MKKFDRYEEVLRIITSKDSSKAIAQEYGYLTFLYGEMGVDWHLYKQTLSTHEEDDGTKIPVDIFQIELEDGKLIEVCMDISSFYGNDL